MHARFVRSGERTGELIHLQEGAAPCLSGEAGESGDVVYMVLVLRANAENPGETWRISRIFHDVRHKNLSECDSALRKVNGIRSPVTKNERTTIQSFTAASLLLDDNALLNRARSTKRELNLDLGDAKKRTMRKANGEVFYA